MTDAEALDRIRTDVLAYFTHKVEADELIGRVIEAVERSGRALIKVVEYTGDEPANDD